MPAKKHYYGYCLLVKFVRYLLYNSTGAFCVYGKVARREQRIDLKQ